MKEDQRLKLKDKNAHLSSPRLIVALDVDTSDKAEQIVDMLYPAVGIFKVGLQLFTRTGPRMIEFIHRKGARVFLDLKFFDIPNTVAGAVRSAQELDVAMLTLHIAGGREMLTAAVGALKSIPSRAQGSPLLLGVTVLTSQKASADDVVTCAKIGLECGLDGVVSSVHEAALIRKDCGKECIIVTPGIRPQSAAADDQKRTATVREAAAAGSDFLVVGRPILTAPDPLKMVQGMLEELRQGG